MKSLDVKLAELRANRSSRAFILADAKDADMAFGIRAPGPRGFLSRRGARPAQFSPEVWSRQEFGYRNLPEFLDIIREVVHQKLVDIMLMSAYVSEQLAIKDGLFRDSPVTPAARANDTTDVWAVRHGCYTREPSQPFRSASIDQIQCGEVSCERNGRDDFPGANLGLYSITFVNELEQDRAALLWYKEFREEAERKGFRHFLEIFDPNVQSGVPPEKLGEFINDNIIRSLAGVPESGRPLFLKIVYHGPRAMEELAQYDPNLVVDHYALPRVPEFDRNLSRTDATTVVDEVHNVTLAICEYLSPINFAIYVLYAVLVGSKTSFGIAQMIRYLPARKLNAIRLFRASMTGLALGIATHRRLQSQANRNSRG